MKKFIKSSTFILLFALTCAIINFSVLAYSENFESENAIEQRIKQINAENRRLDELIGETEAKLAGSRELMSLYADKINAEKDRIDYYNNLLFVYESKADERESNIKQLQTIISDRQAEIDRAVLEIRFLSERNSQNLEIFAKLVAQVYMKNAGLAEIIGGSRNFAEAVISYQAMRRVSKRNLDFMQDLLSSIEAQELKTETLGREIRELEVAKTTLEAETEALYIKKAEAKELADECRELNENYKLLYHRFAGEFKSLELERSAYSAGREYNQAQADEFERQLAELILQKQQGESGQVALNLSGGDWQRPLAAKFTRITTYFGYDAWRDGQHNGIDIAGTADNPINWADIYAARDGVVVHVKTTYISGYSYGKYIVVDHGGGYATVYAHCNDIYVTKGQQVKAGEKIGAVGSTGWSTGPHLHFEIRKDGVALNPLDFIAVG
ncbi:MAG: peptidoglycan DD-metalloendopeptidase family protein [Oscillospiraceae bacterium]|nr:peptidoglycan DD-metalloendopeptidase family protein [Oscillospiraceae bacterium]